MNIFKQILKNTSAGWFEMLILFISGMAITPILIKYFGKEGYGVWLLVAQMVGYLSILDLGVSNSLGRFVAKYIANRDAKGLSRIFSTSLFLYCISTFAILLITFMIWPVFSDFFNLSGKYHQIGSWLILLTGFGIAVSLPLRIGQGIFQGIHRFDLMYLFRSLGVILKFLLIIIFFYFWKRGNLILLAAISIGASLLPNILMSLMARNRIPKINIRKEYISKSSIVEIWTLSFSALVLTISANILIQTQILVVGKILDTEAVTLYSIPLKLVRYGSMVISYIIASFVPLSSEMHTLDQKEKLRSLNINGVKIALAISLIILTVAVFFGKPFLLFWLKSTSLQESDFTQMANLLLIMAAGFCIGGPQGVTSKMFLGSGKHWFVAKISIINSVIGLTVGFYLLKYSTLGLYGMAIGWALVYFISGVIIFPRAACRTYNINLFSYLKKAYVPPLIAALPLVLGAYFIKSVINVTSALRLGLCIILSLSIYAVAVYYICLEERQKFQIRMYVNKFIKSVDL